MIRGARPGIIVIGKRGFASARLGPTMVLWALLITALVIAIGIVAGIVTSELADAADLTALDASPAVISTGVIGLIGLAFIAGAVNAVRARVPVKVRRQRR